ncbi:hypothetical protein [Tenacibaculum amylolyticum]|uniref:hypothetical protein n=1 Tax=Tenacibaculum amylolyticum TaxID=104269 RepID=UPI0038B690F7
MKTRKIYIEKNQTQTISGGCCGSIPTETQPTSSFTSTLQTEKQSQKRNGCCG